MKAVHSIFYEQETYSVMILQASLVILVLGLVFFFFSILT